MTILCSQILKGVIGSASPQSPQWRIANCYLRFHLQDQKCLSTTNFAKALDQGLWYLHNAETAFNSISYSIYFHKRFYIFCIFRLTALKSFSRAVVFAIEAIDFRCCSSWNDTLYFPVCLCAHFLATTVTNALSSLNACSILVKEQASIRPPVHVNNGPKFGLRPSIS